MHKYGYPLRIAPMKIILLLSLCVFLVTLILSGSKALAIDNIAPDVSYTIPANGSLGVSSDLSTIVITFTEPMRNGLSYNYSSSLGPHSTQWSDDATQLFINRTEPSTPLTEGSIIQINMNPYGSTSFFADIAGNRLPSYSFSFTIGQANQLAPIVVSTSPGNGAFDVSQTVSGFSVTFNKPMMYGTCINFGSNEGGWGDATKSWSQDSRILYFNRNTPETTLRAGAIFTVTLNPEGCDTIYIRDQEYEYKLGTYSFSFTAAKKEPTVVSTLPINKTVEVDPYVSTISWTFSEEMADAVSFSEITDVWRNSSYQWSADHRTIYITRDSFGTPLPEGSLITFVLNPSGSMNFRDLDGNLLNTYIFSFTVSGAPEFHLMRIDANPDKGFYWPYYLSIPKELSRNTILLVEPNNTGKVTDDLSVHEISAFQLARWRSQFAVDLEVPLLVPIFSRPASVGYMYTHALDRATLESNIPDYIRLDMQLIEMIKDARQRLMTMGHILDPKFFMMGFSASGAFTSRFTTIHPEMVRAAAAGSPAGWPIAPVSFWQGIPMYYPVGVLDLDTIIGQSVNLSSLRKVPQYIYVGDQDRNDALDTRGYPEEEKQEICALLDCSPEPLIYLRWPISEQIYDSVNIANDFVVYPGVAHTITPEMFSELFMFFEARKPVAAKFNPAVLILLLNDP
jgi:Bacterial Ig-like domain